MSPTLATITIMGNGRIGPTITALLGLAATLLALRALLRARRIERPTGSRSDDRTTVLPLGIAALLLGGVFLAAADSGPGTGDGVVGSAAAIALGTLAICLDRITARRRGSSHIAEP